MINNQHRVCFENIILTYCTTCILQPTHTIVYHSTATQFVTLFHIRVRNPLLQKQNKRQFSRILTHANSMSSICQALNKDTNCGDSRQGRGGANKAQVFSCTCYNTMLGVLNYQNHPHRNKKKKKKLVQVGIGRKFLHPHFRKATWLAHCYLFFFSFLNVHISCSSASCSSLTGNFRLCGMEDRRMAQSYFNVWLVPTIPIMSPFSHMTLTGTEVSHLQMALIVVVGLSTASCKISWCSRGWMR